MNDSSQNQFAANVARDLVSQIAPQEIPLFRATSEAYFKDPQALLKDGESREEMLGFGTGEAISLLTPVAIAISVEVVKFVTEEVKKSVKTESSGVINDLVRRMFKKHRPAATEGETPASPTLTVEQLREVHKLVFTKARELRIGEPRAKQLADTLVADLITP